MQALRELFSIGEAGLNQTGHLQVLEGIMTDSEVMSSLHKCDC